jgi:hypothetical protein
VLRGTSSIFRQTEWDEYRQADSPSTLAVVPSLKLDCRIGMIRANQLHDLPWSACAPLAFASASVMYAPALVVPYHFVPWQW